MVAKVVFPTVLVGGAVEESRRRGNYDTVAGGFMIRDWGIYDTVAGEL